jgi:cation diffusion facilitator CzcD-associated flavoprotein CzcO
MTAEEMRMNPTTGQTPGFRVANFSNLDLSCDHLLNFDSDDIETIVRHIRKYADLPYVYVVAKENARQVSKLLSALKSIHSPCYPYALFAIDGVDLDVEDEHLDIVKIGSMEANTVYDHINEYAGARFRVDYNKLRIRNSNPLPTKTDVAIVGAGITGLYAANRLREAGISFCVIEKRDMVGGIWSRYANHSSRVNSSESAYRLLEKKSRSNRDHSDAREILEDMVQLAEVVSGHLFLETEVEKIESAGNRYQIRVNQGGKSFTLESTGVILAINDRVGTPREVAWENQSVFQGKIVTGISNDTEKLDWRNKNVVIVGMGAFAVENARTALEGGANHVIAVCRRHGTVCPKIIDYLNFATPYDDGFKHDKKSNLRNMLYWKKLYDLSGATQPECWMGKIKHEGHTISVSDIWFIGHYLKKIETITGEISGVTENGVYVDGRHPIHADIVINAVGFERNAPVAKELSGYQETYNNNYLARNFLYLADAWIDDDAFNSLFGSSVLEMVKFYIEVFIMFFNNSRYDDMISTPGIEKIPIEDRKWSHYIKSAMALIHNYPTIREIAMKQINQRTRNFMEIHDLESYIAENKREWIETHSMLAGKAMTEEECLPYVFDKLLRGG